MCIALLMLPQRIVTVSAIFTFGGIVKVVVFPTNFRNYNLGLTGSINGARNSKH